MHDAAEPKGLVQNGSSRHDFIRSCQLCNSV